MAPHHKACPQRGGLQGPGPWRALPPAHHPSPQGRTAGLDVECLALGAPLPRGVVIPCAPLLPPGLLRAPQPLGQQVTHRGQGTRAGQPHPKAPPGPHGGLGLAQIGQLLPARRPPWVATGLANHGFPPCGCGSLHTPQSAARRAVISAHCQKTSPCKILLANPKMEQIPCRTRSLEVEGARNMPMHKRWAMALKYTPNEFANSKS